jgi:disulfide bond formation protein DsbB
MLARPDKTAGIAVTPFRAAAAVFLIAAATIGGAWAFQAAGYPPCELCLKQRYAYYAGVPLAALVALLAAYHEPRALVATGLALLALVFAASAVFGAYHAGVEWGFWPGPSGCTGEIAHSSQSLLAQLDTIKVVRCDAAALRILGLSLAGWNALISLALAALAAAGSRATKSA